ncbi:MAG: hypothetical protein LBB17_01635 [Puniceicoccales bacterium]|nr:hypothetical protein [Puniceicoccales bacterium]
MSIEPPDGNSGSQPDLDAPGVGGPSGEGGEIAEKVGRATPEIIVPPVNPFNSIIVFNPGDGLDLDNTVGNLKSGELNKISDILDGSNKYVQKCSLNDILFLVMLILIKSTSEQRESRFESMSARKTVSAMASTAVYELKIAEAKSTYEKEKTAAEMKKIMAIVSMVCGAISFVLSALGPIVQAGNQMAKSISNVLKVVSEVISILATIAQGIVGLYLAEKGKNVAFIRAEIAQTQTFFENTMQQIRNMQEAYSASQRNIVSNLQTMQEILEKQQNTRLSVARNI